MRRFSPIQRAVRVPSLKKANTAPASMEKFFDGMSFHFHKFTQYLLLNVEEAVSQIFEDNRKALKFNYLEKFVVNLSFSKVSCP